MFWSKHIGKHAGWPRVYHSKDNGKAIIVAFHLTPTGAWLADRFIIFPIIYGIYRFGDLMRALERPVYKFGDFIVTLMPSLEENFGDWMPFLMQPIDKNFGREGLIIMVLSMVTIALGSLLSRHLMRKLILKPLIITISPKCMRVWFKRYDWEWIESFHLHSPEQGDMEMQARRRGNSTYYQHSTQVYMAYNNVPVQLASIYEAIKARRLVGRIQAIITEINNRPEDNEGKERF